MAKRTDTPISGVATRAGQVSAAVGTAVRGTAAIAGAGQVQAVGAWLTKLPANHPFYALVGRVASEWSHFEHTLDLIIWDLARWQTSGFSDQIAACITAQIGGAIGRCHAIEALSEFRGIPDKPIISAIRKLRGDSARPADDRARVVHDAWYIEEPSHIPGVFRAMPKTDRRFGVHGYTEPEFNTLLAKIAALQKRSGDISDEISDALNTLRNMPT